MKATTILFCLFVLLAVFGITDARSNFRHLAEEANKDAKNERELQYYGYNPGGNYGGGGYPGGGYYGGGYYYCGVWVYECPTPTTCAYVPKC